VCSCRAEDAVAGAEFAFPFRNSFDHTGEVYAHDKRICRCGGQSFEEFVVDRIDPRISHADEERTVHGGDR